MSTPAATTPVTSAPFVFDDAKFKAKSQELRSQMEKYIGVHNHNPFTWVQTKVIPLEEAYFKGSRTKELFDKMMALNAEAPKVNPDLPDSEVPKTASPQPANTTQVGGGLQLPKK